MTSVSFTINNITLDYLYHHYNCGIGKHRTERTIEIPIADYWLNKVGDNVMELGAVTPYYYPKRIKDIVDPSDSKATIKESLFNVDFTSMDVLSISTIEHVNEGSYNNRIIDPSQENPSLAYDYIDSNTNRYLITFPWGCSDILDERLLDRGFHCNVYMLSRQKNEEWLEVNKSGLLDYGSNMANSIIILEKGNILN